MSQENVEIVRRMGEAFNRGDLGLFLDTLDPEVEWKQINELEPRHGHSGAREAIAQWDEMFDEPCYEAEEYIDAGDQVIVLIKISGRGKTSGAEVEMSSYHLFTLRDGKVIRMHELGPVKRAEALEAAALSEHANTETSTTRIEEETRDVHR
jgi:ketosteroid isomerase-like protein